MRPSLGRCNRRSCTGHHLRRHHQRPPRLVGTGRCRAQPASTDLRDGDEPKERPSTSCHSPNSETLASADDHDPDSLDPCLAKSACAVDARRPVSATDVGFKERVVLCRRLSVVVVRLADFPLTADPDRDRTPTPARGRRVRRTNGDGRVSIVADGHRLSIVQRPVATAVATAFAASLLQQTGTRTYRAPATRAAKVTRLAGVQQQPPHRHETRVWAGGTGLFASGVPRAGCAHT